MTLITNGISTDIPLEDAIGCAEMLISLGRAIPPRDWVPGIAEANPVVLFDDGF